MNSLAWLSAGKSFRYHEITKLSNVVLQLNDFLHFLKSLVVSIRHFDHLWVEWSQFKVYIKGNKASFQLHDLPRIMKRIEATAADRAVFEIQGILHVIWIVCCIKLLGNVFLKQIEKTLRCNRLELLSANTNCTKLLRKITVYHS